MAIHHCVVGAGVGAATREVDAMSEWINFSYLSSFIVGVVVAIVILIVKWWLKCVIKEAIRELEAGKH